MLTNTVFKANENGKVSQTVQRAVKHEALVVLEQILAELGVVRVAEGLAFPVEFQTGERLAVVVNPVVKVDFEVELEAELFLEEQEQKRKEAEAKTKAKQEKIAKAEKAKVVKE